MGIFQQFPYSNFHEFNLDQIIKIMREMQDEWANTKTEWASYKEFIDNYFENLDVSEEVLSAMRIFAADGTLNQIMDPTIATETAEWLSEHITQPTTPVIDTSLSIAGAAADAKAAGDAIIDLRNDLNIAQDLTINENSNSFIWESGGIDGNGAPTTNNARARMKKLAACKYYKSVETDSTLEMVVAIYDTTGTFLGYYNGSTLSLSGTWLQYIDLSNMSSNYVRIITRIKATPTAEITPSTCNTLVKFNSVLSANINDIEVVQDYLFNGTVPKQTSFTTILFYISNGYQLLAGSEIAHTMMFHAHAGEKHIVKISGDGKPYTSALLVGRNTVGAVANVQLIEVTKNIINIDDDSITLVINCTNDGYYFIYWGSNTTAIDSDTLIMSNSGLTSNSAEHTDSALKRLFISVGGFKIDSGRNNLDTDANNDARARTELLMVKNGDLIKSPIYPFIATVFTSDGVYSFNTFDDIAARWINEFTCTSDGYVRLLFKRNDGEDIDDIDLFRIANSVAIAGYTSQNYVAQIVNSSIIRANDGFYQLNKKLGSNNINKDNFLTRGKITKSGNRILDSNGQDLVLTGIGTHNVWEYQNLYTPEVFKTLVLNGINCIRLTVYLKDYRYQDSQLRMGHGYVDHPDEIKAIVDKIIPMATDAGLYVILDWHSYVPSDGSALQYTTEQAEFFTYFSTKYASYDNILYEIQNEPYGNTAAELLTSTQNCASIIRGNNPDAILICGHGSDGVEAMNTLFNVTNNLNVFISPHLYTGSSTVDNAIKPYVDLGIAIFVTEWGNSSSSGTGNPNDAEAITMFNYCHTNGISYCVWKMTYQSMDTAILVYNPDRALYGYGFGGWHDGDLSHNGHLYFDNIWDYHF